MLRSLAVYDKESLTQLKFGGQNYHEAIIKALNGDKTPSQTDFIYIKEGVFVVDREKKITKPCWLVIVSKTPHLTNELKLQLAYLFLNMEHVINQPILNATLEDMYLNTPNYIGKDILIAKTKAGIEETREIMIKNIEAVLKRGEAIENLKDRTEALATQAILFNKQGKKLNNCCGGYVPNPFA